MDITTTLTALIGRATNSIIDTIATDGLKALRAVLDESGFSDSKYLKNYEIYAHVKGDEVIFEIELDAGSIEASDAKTQAAMEEEQAEQIVDRTYNLVRSTGKVHKIADARRPAADARKGVHGGTRDVRKNARDRAIEHKVALKAPRGAVITKDGKLSVSVERSTKDVKSSMKYPSSGYQGIMAGVVERIKRVIAEKFVPKLEEIITDKLK